MWQVVFELDKVMCCRPRGDKGISPFELEDRRESYIYALVSSVNTPPPWYDPPWPWPGD